MISEILPDNWRDWPGAKARTGWNSSVLGVNWYAVSATKPVEVFEVFPQKV